jgi:phage-related protein
MFTKEIKRTGKLTIDKNELRETFQNFTNVYDSLPIESKRRFNQALFIEIRSFLKSKEKNGDTQIKK